MDGIERIAGFGWGLTESRVHHVRGIDSTDTLLGYDLIVWEVGMSLDETRLGLTHSGLTQHVARRKSEIGAHLNAGRPLVIVIPESNRQVGNASVPSDLLPFELELISAGGKHVEIVDPIVAPLFDWDWDGGRPAFEAYMPKPPGRALLRIPHTGFVLGAVAHAGTATILLLPRFDLETFDGDDATGWLDALIEVIARSARDAPLPRWSKRVLVSGEEQLAARLDRDRQTVARAEKRVQQGEKRLAAARRRKLLFTADGKALEAMAAEAFSAIGFEVRQGERGRADLVLRLDERVAVVEVKGTRGSASERNASQLAKWVFGYHADHGRRAKGILLVNGFKDDLLEERGTVFPNQMVRFARQQRLCLVTGVQLLTLWLLADADPKVRQRLGRLLMSTVGPLVGYDDPRARRAVPTTERPSPP